MNEETPDMMEQSSETPAVSQEQSLTSTAEDAILSREKAAFDAYVRNQGMAVPENFKDAGAWFESLKNAQKEYTKSRQEVSDLKKKYEQTPSTANPVKQGDAAPAKEEIPVIPEVLKIPEKKPEEATPLDQTPASEDDWKTWTIEYATTNDLSAETIETIKKKTKLPDYVIQEYMQGQKAKLEIAYTKAADLIGGRDRLAKMFDWASKNLSQAEQDSINQNLSSASWDVALFGLEAKYERATTTSKKNEPQQRTNGKLPIASTQEGITAYQTKREFRSERNNPRFNTDPKFRNYVEQRMMRTNFTKLPN